MIKKVAFTMYPVEDMNRAREFYETVLKLKPGSISSRGGWVEYDLPGGGCLAITTQAMGDKPSANSGGSVAFEVDDIDALVTQLRADGVTIKMETFTSPVCKMAVILDSEGNALILHELSPEHAR